MTQHHVKFHHPNIPPPPVSQPQAYDTGATGTFVGGKINQFRADLSSIQNAISSHNNDFLRFKDLVDEQTSVYQGLSSAIRSRLQIGQQQVTQF